LKTNEQHNGLHTHHGTNATRLRSSLAMQRVLERSIALVVFLFKCNRHFVFLYGSEVVSVEVN
jgi:hypothetical protein